MTEFVFEWPSAHRFETSKGTLKANNEDFQVVESLPEEPTGNGEHLWLTIEKSGQNTAWVARQIAKWAGLKPRDVSYAGLKDRHALTTQTFSVHLPGKQTPSPHLIHVEGVKVLKYARHSKKLKTGQLIGNHFRIRVRDCDVGTALIERQWLKVCEEGVPNYFGPQRFGHNNKNVEIGTDWLLGRAKLPRHHQSIHLSAVRSYLFNKLLSDRVSNNTWNVLQAHDFAQFTEGRAGFYVESPSEEDVTRCQLGKLSPCGSLVGLSKDNFETLDERERSLLAEHVEIINVLEEKKVMRQFRKLRVIPEQCRFDVIEGDPVFSFFLPSGSYATAVLSELFRFEKELDLSE